MAQFRTHYLKKERSYVSTQQSGYFSIDTEMIENKCQIGLMFEYSRMNAPSLSSGCGSGCEIAPFFFGSLHGVRLIMIKECSSKPWLTLLAESVGHSKIISDSVCNIMLPKRRFWKEEQKMKSGFSQHFSRA
jgi:hypothetical protein